MRARIAVALSVVSLALGCTAEISGTQQGGGALGVGASATAGGGSSTAGADVGGTGPCGEWQPGCEGDPTAAPGLSPRLLTKRQYDNTLTLLLKDTYGVLQSDATFARDLATEAPGRSGFAAAPEISPVSVGGYLSASKAVAAAIAPSLSKLLKCDVEAGSDVACITSFVTEFGEVLYRRPLTQQDVQDHVAFYDEELSQLGRSKTTAALSLVRLMLNSPYFLYEWEQGHLVSGRRGATVRLNPFQIASRLSFFLWASGPDKPTIDLAKSGGLDTDEQVAAQAAAMLQSPRAAHGVDSFHEQWLDLFDLANLNKNPEVFANWSPALGQDMASEIQLFTRDLILTGDASVTSLLTSTRTFLNQPTAELYGQAGVSGMDFAAVNVDPARRSGLLTMPGFLASASGPDAVKPFHLGNLLLEKLYCQKLVANPDLIASAPVPQVNRKVVGERAYLEELTGKGVCLGCHVLLNPLAFGLGNFDSLGAWRDVDEHGVPINSAGTLGDTAFSKPAELGQLLAQDERVQSCIAKQWFRFATDSYETSADTHSLEQGWKAAKSTSLDLRQLMLSFATTPSFLYRTPAADEPTQ